jgi:hypothetical protein
MTTIEPRPTRTFWCPSVVQPPEIRDIALGRIHQGDECVHFHAHAQGEVCPGFSDAMWVTDDETKQTRRVYPHDQCWRHPV